METRPTQRPLTGQDARTLGLAALGGALEFYDFIIFVFFTKAIGQLFFPPDTAPTGCGSSRRSPCSRRATSCGPWAAS